MLKLGLFFVSSINLAHKTDFYKRAYAFLPMYLLGPPRPRDLQKSPPWVGLRYINKTKSAVCSVCTTVIFVVIMGACTQAVDTVFLFLDSVPVRKFTLVAWDFVSP